MVNPFIAKSAQDYGILSYETNKFVLDKLKMSQKGKAAIEYIRSNLHLATPDKIDLSKYLHFIRCQLGGGCWDYSKKAAWDIMNEITCPFSPNLSTRLAIGFHVRRDLWEEKGGLNSPDGRFHNPAKGFSTTFGNSTEGTEPFFSAYPFGGPDLGWSFEGVNEADNYRLKSEPQSIIISSENFINVLADGKPIILGISWTDGGHLIALVGYDKTKKTFIWVNSQGDTWGNNGFDNFTFEEIDNKSANKWGLDIKIDTAEIIEIYSPKPVPAARISFSHTNRSNVQLWLSVKILPCLSI
ncbi:MAG: hypothetical protein KBA97_01760 [Methanothrix sp.]|nr:hypothetical protein [Methanothrix sp.]